MRAVKQLAKRCLSLEMKPEERRMEWGAEGRMGEGILG